MPAPATAAAAAAAAAPSDGPGLEAPRAWRALSQAGLALLSLARMLLGLVMGVAAAPVLAPALGLSLPNCAAVRRLERLAACAVQWTTWVAGVRCLVGARCDALGFADPAWAWLPPPLVREWESPLMRGHSVLTYDQPGRWMGDAELLRLYTQLLDIARASMREPPAHRLFERGALRAAYSNRVISVAYDGARAPVGFTALVYLPYAGSRVVHLGLTMIGARARGRRLQSPLFTRCLALAGLNQCQAGFYVTNIAASPAGIGSVADYFHDVFPHYAGATKRRPYHLDIATHLLRHFRHEFGCSRNAVFDPAVFVVRASNEPAGGGSAAFIKEDGKPVSRHRNPLCNAYCRQHLNLARGDEILQVGRLQATTTILKYFRKGSYFAAGKKSTQMS